MSIFIDTGPLYAFFDKKDEYSQWAGEQLAQISQPLVTCEAVITETVFIMQRTGIYVDALFEFIRRGNLLIQPAFNTDTGQKRIQGIVNTYNNLPASFADACVVYLAETGSRSKVLTVDNHFTIYRTSKGRPLSLIIPS